MRNKSNLVPLRYETRAQEQSNERAAETKTTARLLARLAKKLGPLKKPSVNAA